MPGLCPLLGHLTFVFSHHEVEDLKAGTLALSIGDLLYRHFKHTSATPEVSECNIDGIAGLEKVVTELVFEGHQPWSNNEPRIASLGSGTSPGEFGACFTKRLPEDTYDETYAATTTAPRPLRLCRGKRQSLAQALTVRTRT